MFIKQIKVYYYTYIYAAQFDFQVQLAPTFKVLSEFKCRAN